MRKDRKMSKFRKWLIEKLGGFTESYMIFEKDGSISFSTDSKNWTYGIKEGER